MTPTNKMMIQIKTIRLLTSILVISFFSLTFFSCKETTTPRPRGYFRVDLPPHDYSRFDSTSFPYAFDFSKSAQILPRNEKGENYWIDLNYPTLNANIYCSYKPVRSDLFELSEDSRNIVYKHAVRADAISEVAYENQDRKVYGILYELSGNAATPYQFILTDSTKHFFRAALYFESTPNKDSIAPIAQYIQEDIVRLMESFEWKK